MVDDAHDMDDTDVLVGRNLRAIREARGLTQADVAEQLAKEHGLAFHQQTIVKVEKGQRPLRIKEAVLLADVLDVTVGDLTRESITIDVAANVARLTRECLERWEQLGEVGSALLDAQSTLDWYLREKNDVEIPGHILDEARAAVTIDLVKIAESTYLQRDANQQVDAAQLHAAISVGRRPAEPE